MRHFWLWLGLIVAGSLQAQARPPRQILSTDVPFLADLQPLALQAGLPDLQRPAIARIADEVRIWYGFGLGGIGLYRLQHIGDTWRYSSSRVRRVDNALSLTGFEDLGAADSLWTAMADAGLLSLPPAPARDSTGLSALDGFGFVFEWRYMGVFGAGGTLNPATHCSPDDKAFLRVWVVLFPSAAEQFTQCAFAN